MVLCIALATGLASAQYLETTLQLSYGLSDMLWNPSNDHVYVSNWDKGTVTVIDGATNQITAVIDVASDAGFLCLNPTAGRIYCTSGESDTLNVIDALGDTLIGSKRVRGYPCMMACSPLVNKLYVGCPDDCMVRVYDGTGTTLVAEITCGEWNTPRLLLWHPVSNRVFCVTGCDSQIDTVLVIDCSTDSVTTRIPVGSMPSSICVNPVNDLVYVCSRYHVHALSPTGDSIIAVIPQPYDNSTHICAVPFANKMYVTRGNWVHVIDCDDHVVSESIATHSASGIARPWPTEYSGCAGWQW